MNQLLLEMMKNNYSLFYSLVFSIVQNREDAEDVLQNVYVKLLSYDFSHLKDEYLRAYVCKICKNAAIDFLNHRQITLPLDLLACQTHGPEDNLANLMAEDILRSCVSGLPPDVRGPLKEHILYDVPLARLARQYHVSREKLRYWKKFFLKQAKNFLDLEPFS